MKPYKMGMLSFVLLVLCVSNAFASVATTTSVIDLNSPADTKAYFANPMETWSKTLTFDSDVLSANFNMNISLNGPWNTNGQLSTLAVMVGSSNEQILYSGLPAGNTLTISSPLTLTPGGGVYTFLVRAYDMSGTLGAYFANKEANWTINSATVTTTSKTPIPAAALLLGSGLVGLLGINRFRRTGSIEE